MSEDDAHKYSWLDTEYTDQICFIRNTVRLVTTLVLCTNDILIKLYFNVFTLIMDLSDLIKKQYIQYFFLTDYFINFKSIFLNETRIFNDFS